MQTLSWGTFPRGGGGGTLQDGWRGSQGHPDEAEGSCFAFLGGCTRQASKCLQCLPGGCEGLSRSLCIQFLLGVAALPI